MTADSKEGAEAFAEAARRMAWDERQKVGPHDIAAGRFVITKHGRVGVMKNSMLIRGHGEAAVQVTFAVGPDYAINLSDLRLATQDEVDAVCGDVRAGIFGQEADVAVNSLILRNNQTKSDAKAATYVIVTEVNHADVAAFHMRCVPIEGGELNITVKRETRGSQRETAMVTYKVVERRHFMNQSYDGEWHEAVNLIVKSIEDPLHVKSI